MSAKVRVLSVGPKHINDLCPARDRYRDFRRIPGGHVSRSNRAIEVEITRSGQRSSRPIKEGIAAGSCHQPKIYDVADNKTGKTNRR